MDKHKLGNQHGQVLTFSRDFPSVLVLLHQETEVVSLWVASWETSLDHLGVREKDSVE